MKSFRSDPPLRSAFGLVVSLALAAATQSSAGEPSPTSVAAPDSPLPIASESGGKRALGLSLARDGRCEAALEVLSPLRAPSPLDAELERLVGECALRLSRFPLALEALEAVRGVDPESDRIDLRLAQAYYHAGRLDDAREALSRTPADVRADAAYLLYDGLVAFDRGEIDVAQRQLEAAVASDDDSVEPLASFQLAKARARARDEDGARASYARVVEGYTGTAWADQAARAIEVLDGTEPIPVWASAELGFEADDNALIRGRGVGRPGEISGQSDTRLYWFADVGALFFQGARTSAGSALRYGGSEQHELERFDTHAPGATLWLDRQLGWPQSMLRLQYDFDTAWIDAEDIRDDPFVLSHLVSASLFKSWPWAGATTLGASLGLDDYRYRRDGLDVPDASIGTCQPCSPNGVDEIDETDRDGLGPILSLVHRQALPEPGAGLSLPWIEGGYRYQLYVSEGREYDHQRHQIELGAGIRLPLALDLSVRGRYAYVPFANRSVFPDPKDELAAAAGPPGTTYFLDASARREHETGVRVVLQRAFGEHVLVAARWSRTRNRSTSDVFDYSRDLFGISLRIGFGG